MALMVLCAHIATGIGICLAAISGSNTQIGIALQGVIAVLWLLTMGFYIPINQMPVWMRWLKWAQVYYYGYQGVLRIQYTGQTIHHVVSSTFLSAENLERIGNATEYGADIVFDQLDVNLSLGQCFGAIAGIWVFVTIRAILLGNFEGWTKVQSDDKTNAVVYSRPHPDKQIKRPQFLSTAVAAYFSAIGFETFP